MRCPKCNSEMILVNNIWVCGNLNAHKEPVFLYRKQELQLAFLNELPTPIALLTNEYLNETIPFVKLHRMIDTVEMVVRYFFMVAVFDLYSQLGTFPEPYKMMLTRRLVKPLYSDWGELLSSALTNLGEKKKECIIKELPNIWFNRWKPMIGSNAGNPYQEFLPLRNNIAHAGRLTNQVANKILSKFMGQFESALKDLEFLTQYELIAINEDFQQISLKGIPNPDSWNYPIIKLAGKNLEPGKVYLLSNERQLNLFPLQAYDVVLQWSDSEKTFSSIDNKAVPLIYLRYNPSVEAVEFTALSPNAYHSIKSDDILTKFLEVFNLNNWRQEELHNENKRKLQNKHTQTINALGYDFADIRSQLPDVKNHIGRSTLLQDIQNWIRKNSKEGGRLMISGPPGIGKSSLVNTLITRISSKGKEIKEIIVPFFFREGDRRCNIEHFYYSSILYLSNQLNIEIDAKNNNDIQMQFLETLKIITRQLKEEQTLIPIIFLIVGVTCFL